MRRREGGRAKGRKERPLRERGGTSILHEPRFCPTLVWHGGGNEAFVVQCRKGGAKSAGGEGEDLTGPAVSFGSRVSINWKATKAWLPLSLLYIRHHKNFRGPFLHASLQAEVVAMFVAARARASIISPQCANCQFRSFPFHATERQTASSFFPPPEQRRATEQRGEGEGERSQSGSVVSLHYERKTALYYRILACSSSSHSSSLASIYPFNSEVVGFFF